MSENAQRLHTRASRDVVVVVLLEIDPSVVAYLCIHFALAMLFAEMSRTLDRI